MSRTGKIFMLSLVLLLAAANARAAVKTGEPAPDFNLTDINGQSQSLSQFKGKYVVLEWINNDCPFVKKHYGSGNMQSLQIAYGEKGVIWLSINSSAPGKEGSVSAEKARELTQRNGAAPTAFFLDLDGKVGKLYGAQATPHMFIINPEGLLIYQGAIDDTPSVDAADIPAAKNYVKAALDEAMAGQPVTTAATKAYGCSVKY
ncbi:MAG: alkyl hydroperoxide reductase [Omnitrophica WOR_2 bacterium RIFCSPHIGHO2_01_FULL_48_9]|nr:MAG: alkyl hydroperoxide reductase [Omnitrophica WOR_2 bacterium RIFCSPHIGHO2_01_FULL_48_9]